ncbi:unnamed protein product [Paramecium sonneborni]|uniref:GAF domain-containing protein n=1 Tax=Paramecium sonneborni TaxID=65129 RepID=A0A8S1RQ62_9CILI|nr:unnamed protein product [Paramecium sonneborni]CAD8130911.1 unnamed protein product [Paramecium sonneborni]
MNQPNKEQEYEKVLELLDHFIKKYSNLGRNAIETSIVSLLKNNVSGLFFVGFYEVIDDKYLEVGPYQSTILATPRIEKGKGQCGQCWSEGKVQIQEDVKVCQNYIACDNETQSEIVIPVIKNGVVQSVLDIDSEHLSRFNEVDSNYLQRIVEYLI